MREKKFRAWIKKDNKMTSVWSINFSKASGDPSYPDANEIATDDNHLIGVDTQAILMQFTGLLDKNGTPIFEKDFVKDKVLDLQLIDWCQECLGYQCFYEYESKMLCHNCDGNFDISELEGIEVIGNVYESPELNQP